MNYETVLKKLKQKEDFVLYIGRPDCKDCQEFEPYLKKYTLSKDKQKEKKQDYIDELSTWLNQIYQDN